METRSTAAKKKQQGLARPHSQSSVPAHTNALTRAEESARAPAGGSRQRSKRPRSAPAASAKRKRETDSSHASSRQRVHVAVRVRPQSDREVECQSVPVVDVISDSEVLVRETLSSSVDYLRANRLKTRQFAFDSAFGRDASQTDVYAASAAELVAGVSSFRFNATCFCYGATGAGKTYTMLGTEENPGVMLLALRDLYSRLYNTGASVSISFIEIYNEQVRDLLSSSSKELVLREDPRKGVTVAGMTELKADSVDGVMELLQQGNGRRTTEPTNKNATSSRSHAILQVMVESRNSGRVSKLSMIDLAGSERTLASESRTARSAEGAHINKSLLALSGCISSLVEGRKHIPYRDSKLTQLLKDSLGGSCQTAMIANVSPSHLAFGDTSNTLHWASRAKQIRSTTQLNEETMDALKQRSIAEAKEQRRNSGGGQSPAHAKLQEENRRLAEENRELKNEVEELKRKLEELSGAQKDESPRKGDDRRRRKTGPEPAEYIRGLCAQGPSHTDAGPSNVSHSQHEPQIEDPQDSLYSDNGEQSRHPDLEHPNGRAGRHAYKKVGNQVVWERDVADGGQELPQPQRGREAYSNGLESLQQRRQRHSWHQPSMQISEALQQQNAPENQQEESAAIELGRDGHVKRRDSIRWQRKRERRASKESAQDLQPHLEAQQHQFEQLQQARLSAGGSAPEEHSKRTRQHASVGGLAELDENRSGVMTRSAAVRASNSRAEADPPPQSVSPVLKRTKQLQNALRQEHMKQTSGDENVQPNDGSMSE